MGNMDRHILAKSSLVANLKTFTKQNTSTDSILQSLLQIDFYIEKQES